jgi:Raf kinase inhibitor-like YbhB/YbcL family protein
MKITSTAFQNGASIPPTYAKDGQNQNPPLTFSEIPANAQSLLLMVEDPDAPRGLVTHWIVFNIDPKSNGVPAGQVPAGALQGMNVHNEARYTGPRPPDKEHRYFFRLSALDTKLHLPNGAQRGEVEHAAQGHVIATAELMGRFAPMQVNSHA